MEQCAGPVSRKDQRASFRWLYLLLPVRSVCSSLSMRWPVSMAVELATERTIAALSGSPEGRLLAGRLGVFMTSIILRQRYGVRC